MLRNARYVSRNPTFWVESDSKLTTWRHQRGTCHGHWRSSSLLELERQRQVNNIEREKINLKPSVSALTAVYPAVADRNAVQSFEGNRELGSGCFAAAFAEVSFTLHQTQTRCHCALSVP